MLPLGAYVVHRALNPPGATAEIPPENVAVTPDRINPADVGDAPKKNQKAVRVSLIGTLDVRVWKKNDTSRALFLHDPGALPLRAGDFMRIEAKMDRPAYLYLVYLDSAGVVSPLFPWKNYEWQARPAEEPRQELQLPEDPVKDFAPLADSPSGIEAIFLLARATPLTSEENLSLPQHFAGWPRARKGDVLRGMAWLTEQEPPRFSKTEDRGRLELAKAVESDDPVEHTRRLVRSLHALFGDVRAVCYSFQGTKDN